MEFSSLFGVCLLFIFYVVWILHGKWCSLKLLQLTALIMLSDFLFSEISIIQCALLKIQSSFPSFQLQVITFFSFSLSTTSVLFIQNTEHAVHFLYSHFFLYTSCIFYLISLYFLLIDVRFGKICVPIINCHLVLIC